LCTDDTEIYGRYAGRVYTFPGDGENIKITYSGDLKKKKEDCSIVVTGFGYDIHPLVEGRPLILGGVTIPFHKGEAGYSDGDAALHALIDGILGAAVMGDIGTRFPPGNPAYKGISSIVLLRKTVDLIHDAGYVLYHADITIVIEHPKIGPYKEQVRNTIADAATIPVESVSVKAKTKEGFPPVGTGDAVECYASVQLTRR
jgi:2-C-methyl-D-erythritol 2,4-cyclodiphosphate synthase